MTGSTTDEPPEIWPLGEAALLVVFSLKISDDANDRVHALAASLHGVDLPGLTDVVPAYSSLLVQFDPLILPEPDLRAALIHQLASEGAPHERSGSRMIGVPVVYGGECGPDLAALARRSGVSEDEVVGLHTSRTYRVYFTGFMPGFAYMGPVADQIAAPRLDVPRVRVPQGSVGIAGAQTGIYPLASPGGWQIIGRTPMRTWDLDRDPPALFLPGDRVQFVPVASADFEKPPVAPDVQVPAHPVFAVQEAGGLVTVQDLGRPGLGRYGVPRGGAMDPTAAARANALMGNPQNAAVLEITWPGLELEALRTTVIAVTGADLGCRVEGREVPPGISWLVREGQHVWFEGAGEDTPGLRAYLAAAGGIDVPEVLGSRSTLLTASFGGLSGRPVRAGDVLGIVVANHFPGSLAGRMLKCSHGGARDSLPVRIIRYEGPNATGVGAWRAFAGSEWRVSEKSDRTGTRLEPVSGAPVTGSGGEVTSFGMVRGAVQLPPGGLPVILNADHGTTGGYPLLGVVPSVDWSLLAHASPGQRLAFSEITLEEACSLRAHCAAQLERDLRSLAGH